MNKFRKMNYMALFSVQRDIEEAIKKACPDIRHASGIYFYTREEFNPDTQETKRFAYIGLSVDVLKRNVSHMLGYQAVDLSLRKRGFFNEVNNPEGWHLNVLFYPQNQIEERESYYIDQYQKRGYILLNIESGGREGKTLINERKPAKGYKDGLKQGYLNAKRDVAKLFDKNLTYSINGKTNKNKEKALEKFNVFLKTDEI